jgi:hypothetical protein
LLDELISRKVNIVFGFFQIDKEIKRLRLEEEKRIQDLKDQEKRNERARKLEEIQNLLEK